ncbi:MAG: hypothetical protein Kow0074_03790 [Candidatus Zixiibacteriota bacterium]
MAPVGSGDFSSDISILQDTLGFNMIYGQVYNQATAESLIARTFFAVESDSAYHAGYPADYAQGWHLVWQSDSASNPPWFQGSIWMEQQGRMTIDGADTVWVIGTDSSDTAGLMKQTGGSHYKHKILGIFEQPTRTATFKLKATNVDSADAVARIYAWRRYVHDIDRVWVVDTMKMDTLYGWQFDTTYKDFSISWGHENPVAAWHTVWMHYAVDWLGNGVLYFDEVLSTDNTGIAVVAGDRDAAIDGYTDRFTFGTDGSYLLGWWLLDEWTKVEQLTCWEYVSSRLRLGPGGKGGFQQFPSTFDAWSFSKMTTADHLMCISYPFISDTCIGGVPSSYHAVSTVSDNPGGDSISLQTIFRNETGRFKFYKHLADSAGMVFWPKVGAMEFYQTRDGCECFQRNRYPTGTELLAHCNLALACGADALSFWTWGGDYCYVAGIYPGSQSYYAIRDTISPFITAVGDIFYDLKWLGADSSEVSAAITGSFVDSIRSVDFPAKPYLEVAIFQDTTTQDDYFFLVNRRCLASETQQISAWLDLDSGYYHIVDQFSHDSTLISAAPTGGHAEFATSLEPGQGKLFKVIDYHPDTLEFPRATGTTPHYWYGNVKLTTDIVVDTGDILGFAPGCKVHVPAGVSRCIDSYGDLIIGGAASDSVRLVSLAPSPSEGDWYGIRHYGPGDLSIAYASIRHAYKGVLINDTTGTATATISHCSIEDVQLTGISVDSHEDTDIDVLDTWIKDMGYYGVRVIEGAPHVDGCTFTGDFKYAVYVDGGWQVKPCRGKIWNCRFENIEANNSYGVYYSGTRNREYDGSYDWQTDTLLKNNVYVIESGYGASNQSGYGFINCYDPIQTYMNAVWGDFGTPLIGIINWSTSLLLSGDVSEPESLSAINGCLYGSYNISQSSSDTAFAVIRETSIHSNTDVTSYGVWVNDVGRVDLGTAASNGNNVLRGRCECTPGPTIYSVYNSFASNPLSAVGNFWWGDACSYCTYGNVVTSSPLASNPFPAGTAKLAVPVTEYELSSIPDEFTVLEAYPNPFNSSTTIHYHLAAPQEVTVAVYNVLGQRVTTVWDGEQEPGDHFLVWDGRNSNGQAVSSGVYFYRISTANKQTTKPVVLVK